MVKDHNEAFEDVSLGPLLGQGGFGKVYRGLWNGAAVAVKVMHILVYSFKGTGVLLRTRVVEALRVYGCTGQLLLL